MIPCFIVAKGGKTGSLLLVTILSHHSHTEAMCALLWTTKVLHECFYPTLYMLPHFPCFPCFFCFFKKSIIVIKNKTQVTLFLTCGQLSSISGVSC